PHRIDVLPARDGLSRSVAPEQARGYGVEAFLPEQPNAQAVVPEQRLESRLEDVEAARIAPEGWQHEAASVADEAGASDRVAVQGRARGGVHVPGDLVGDVARRRYVAQRDALHLDLADNSAPEPLADVGIVVAGDPDPFAVLLQ